MKIEVKNFMGCGEATVETGKVTFVAGLNHQGKSSFLIAAKAALTGQTQPLGLRKADMGMIVKTGTATASVNIEDDGNITTINYPKAELMTSGENPIFISPIAAGDTSLVDLPIKDRSEYLRKLTHNDPTIDDLKKYLADHYVENPNIAAAVWQKVEQDGFAASLQRFQDLGRNLKAQWSVTTGENFGKAKAKSWQPQNWTSDLINSSEESLQADSVRLQKELEDFISKQAVDENELKKLEQVADSEHLLTANDEYSKALADYQQAKKEHNEATLKWQEKPVLKVDDDKMICPHCGKPLVIRGRKIVEYKEPTPAELEANNALIAEVTTAMRNAEAKLDNATAKMIQARNKVDELTLKNKKLLELKKHAGGNVTQQDIDCKREEIRQAAEKQQAFKQYKDAQKIAGNIEENQVIIDALDAGGIRQSAAQKTLIEVNEKLKKVCDCAEWGEVAFDNDFTISMGGRPYVLLSESEQKRVKITLQAVISEYQQAKIIIIDGAEILDKKGKTGLLKFLLKAPFAAIVGMMLPNPEKAPLGLASRNAGIRTYWVENGNFMEIL